MYSTAARWSRSARGRRARGPVAGAQRQHRLAAEPLDRAARELLVRVRVQPLLIRAHELELDGARADVQDEDVHSRRGREEGTRDRRGTPPAGSGRTHRARAPAPRPSSAPTALRGAPSCGPARASRLPYRCSARRSAAASAATGIGRARPSSHRSPSRLAIAPALTSAGEPSGSPHTARTSCSNWLVAHARSRRVIRVVRPRRELVHEHASVRREEELDGEQPLDVQPLGDAERDLGARACRPPGSSRAGSTRPGEHAAPRDG